VKSEVMERRVRRVVLRPSPPTDDFLSGPESDFDQPEVSFSSNCIVLRISGPDVTGLNFIDLPGSFVKVCSLSLTPLTGLFAGVWSLG
jgi:hypothetical protein